MDVDWDGKESASRGKKMGEDGVGGGGGGGGGRVVWQSCLFHVCHRWSGAPVQKACPTVTLSGSDLPSLCRSSPAQPAPTDVRT